MDQCANTNDLNTIFPQPTEDGDKKYRFFNQPIEQIPGFKADMPQILVHRPNCGLQWFTLDQCLPVVTCLKLQSSELKVERKRLVVIKDFDMSDDNDCDIEITQCPS
jgi:hypothetical protein